ncbi:MAG TPA: CBS domain-containing protein [Anaerolineae bacterium]|nr:CBS domain-containing protein [Anaerolineae bacterium]
MAADSFTVIVTHEHTDFDALASMLGAHKLFPEAVPVLPRTLNRNLREFLALYRSGLPFRQQEELPRRLVDRVIVVDTQSFTTVRGMKPDTPGLIIDHHDLPQTPEPGWSHWGGEVGATATLLVEKLAERSLALTPLEATLLLLGIYEDTGSLVYVTTTPRDLRASAWLLEQGANLQVLRRFLHHPLSPAQTDLYSKLAENSQVHDIAGQSVVIATAYAPDYNDEISTLAHSLRDVYEPAGLFLLVDLDDRIQMVARSTSDAVDVGSIAKQLGGGGHARAAAALIRNRSVDDVQAQLLDLLQETVKPSLTVAQIMTHGNPITVPPGTTIEEMAPIIQRYGFEGYPVVETQDGQRASHAGQLRGIISRRQVDRATHHGLASHPIDRYMRTGRITVTPDTSIADLQRLMIESGWGQIPVVDPASDQIIGIVTRTDLIKLWGSPAAHSRREDIALRMESSLPAPLLATLRTAGQAAEALGYPLYAVGGFVRDLLLGRPNFDVDLVVEGSAIELTRRLAKAHGGRVRDHRRFGTAKWILPTGDDGAAPRSTTGLHTVHDGPLPAALDFVSARTEFYAEPTALPTVERGSIKLDLHRRDFSINTLAINLTPGRWGELLDFYGGERDLQEGLVRVLHTHSFVDDPTRILRAARFEQRFNFRIEQRTAELIGDAVDLLDRVTPARVRHELELIFAESRPEQALRRLEELGVLAHIHSGLHVDDWVVSRFESLRAAIQDRSGALPADVDQLYFAIWTYRLEALAFAQLDQRLNLMRSTLAVLDNLHDLKGDVPRLEQLDLQPSEIYHILQPASDSTRFLLPIITASETVKAHIRRYEQTLRYVRPRTDGRDLKRMGLAPGPLYRQVLDAARGAWMDGRIQTEAEERALVDRLVRQLLNQPAAGQP